MDDLTRLRTLAQATGCVAAVATGAALADYFDLIDQHVSMIALVACICLIAPLFLYGCILGDRLTKRSKAELAQVKRDCDRVLALIEQALREYKKAGGTQISLSLGAAPPEHW